MSYSTAVKEGGGGGGEEDNKKKSWNQIMEEEEEQQQQKNEKGGEQIFLKSSSSIKEDSNSIIKPSKDESEKEEEIKNRLYSTLCDYINHIIIAKNNKNKIVSNDEETNENIITTPNKKNTIQLVFFQNKVIVKGDKDKYGLIVGPRGTTLNKLSSKYNNVAITVPNKNVNSNEIIVKGGYEALSVVYEIIEIIKPK